MAKLSERQRKQIVQDSVNGLSQNQIAIKYGVSQKTVSVTLNKDKITKKVLEEKNTQTILDMLAYYKSKAGIAQDITNQALEQILTKIKGASIKELTSLIKTIKEVFAAPDVLGVEGIRDKIDNIVVEIEDASVGDEDEADS